MCERFLKLNLEDEKNHQGDWLARNYPSAFLLLYFIARRARRHNGHPDGLIIGDALIASSDFEPQMSRQNFRTAIEKLVEFGYISLISNGKNLFVDRKSTIKVTITGLLVNLCNTVVWDINPDEGNQQTNQQPTNDQPTGNHKQERIRKKKKEKEEQPPTPSLPKIKFRELVELTQHEHDKLLAKNGQEFLDTMLNELNSAKGSKGYTYKSDYHTMTEGGWVFKKVRKDTQNPKAQNERPYRASPTPPGNSPGSETKFYSSRVLRSEQPVEENSGIAHG